MLSAWRSRNDRMVLDRQEICRLRQNLRQDATKSVPSPSRSTPKPPANQPANLFKRVVNRQVSGVQGPLPEHPDADDALAQQLHQLKAFYEDKVSTLAAQVADVTTQLSNAATETACLENQVNEMQTLIETQYEKLRRATDERASLMAWCREREHHWKRVEDGSAALTRQLDDLVARIKSLDAARTAFEIEHDQQLRAWTAHKEDWDQRMQQMQFQNDMNRKTIHDLSTRLEAVDAAKVLAEATVETLQQTNRQLHAQLDEGAQANIVLQGQLQMEIKMRTSVVADNRILVLDLQNDREAALATQARDHESLNALEQRLRDTDMACWTLKQQLQRTTNDTHVLSTRCAKAEATVEQLTLNAEGLKDTIRTLTSEVQRLVGMLRDQEGVLEAKERSLTKLRRELAETHDRLADEEERKLEAQKDASSLSQRMAALRRENMQLIHRLESPIPASWPASS
ncbi:hypothetical protein SDRG_05115 [Saprolegnia diclina VS20]|uniref:Uncharacterized protein n=1 Tax=Saprolegnia diclina (strain VS20) TaxID=1156394 RepID=T0S4B8_SAPDV|nr:hypothetical protein SDRG_05115 [Saprolegnia diclina VS20]EQC37512.1 hypothetical protein SDRG_05115 [Saprolegnia diclina VS20]|eukprot:XP_008609032.1 hypothetical protein SDRG_05115 [Saprolegnia diclina VS20]